VDVTFMFISNYLTSSFSVDKQIAYESLIGFHMAHSTDFKTIQFMATAKFLKPSDATIFIPSTADVDLLLKISFNQPVVTTLLTMLQNLPGTNPYSQTTAVLCAQAAIPTSMPSSRQQSSETGKGVPATASITGAILAVCLFTAIVSFYRWGFIDKIRGKKKAPLHSMSSDNETNVYQRDTSRMSPNVDLKSFSDWTSSVGSCPPSSNSSSIEDKGYCSRPIDDDIEIKFSYPACGGMNVAPYFNEPLFPQSPLISEQEDVRRKRHNI